MTEPLPREEMIELLNKLGSDGDDDVLEAAREIHARIAATGMTWDAFLVPDQADVDSDDGDDADELEDDDAVEIADPEEEDADEPSGAKDAKDAESLALIDKLLAIRGLSSDMRDELKGYKADIAEGEFETRDQRYVRALHARLSKRR